jgi:hypothetical protein
MVRNVGISLSERRGGGEVHAPTRHGNRSEAAKIVAGFSAGFFLVADG